MFEVYEVYVNGSNVYDAPTSYIAMLFIEQKHYGEYDLVVVVHTTKLYV